MGGLALAGSGRAVLRWSGAKSMAGATLRKAWRAIATLGRQPLIDHDNLEAFADPVDYDRQDTSDTGIAFYASLARETGGPVLEIACGTGRVAIPIARQGFAVTGLDVVPGMLERARSKAAGLPIRWIEGDARVRPRRAVPADLLDGQRLPGLREERRPGGAARERTRPPP